MDMNQGGPDRSAIDVAVGRRLEDARGRMSRRELSKKSGVSEKTIQRFEKGERSPELRTLFALCRALNVDPGEFVDGAMDILAEEHSGIDVDLKGELD